MKASFMRSFTSSAPSSCTLYSLPSQSAPACRHVAPQLWDALSLRLSWQTAQAAASCTHCSSPSPRLQTCSSSEYQAAAPWAHCHPTESQPAPAQLLSFMQHTQAAAPCTHSIPPHQPYLQAHDSSAGAKSCHSPAPCAHCPISQMIKWLQAAAQTSASPPGPVPCAGRQSLSLPQVSVAKAGAQRGTSQLPLKM